MSVTDQVLIQKLEAQLALATNALKYLRGTFTDWNKADFERYCDEVFKRIEEAK